MLLSRTVEGPCNPFYFLFRLNFEKLYILDFRKGIQEEFYIRSCEIFVYATMASVYILGRILGILILRTFYFSIARLNFEKFQNFCFHKGLHSF